VEQLGQKRKGSGRAASSTRAFLAGLGTELLAVEDDVILDSRTAESDLSVIDYCKIAQIKKEPVTAPFTLWVRVRTRA